MDVVITTIFPPTSGMKTLSEGLAARGGNLWVLGDRPGPVSYDLPRVKFYDLKTQASLPLKLAPLLPERHYTRKNLGYLLAIQNGAQMIVETDDDNIPLAPFWEARKPELTARSVSAPGWVNMYRAFSKARIWPRGFPLEQITSSFEHDMQMGAASTEECLIQQGLANENPDVDAVYRLTSPLPLNFDEGSPIALGRGCWCPFNSQNTTFFKAALPLLYLPTFCSFRMTDIWRSFVAQRCLWEMNSKVAFLASSVYQERNEHNLLKDFEQEIPGYLKNEIIRGLLDKTTLRQGRGWKTTLSNQLSCYETLVQHNIIPAQELELVKAWETDLLTFA